MQNQTTTLLERYYKAFIDQPSDWFFFLGIAEYVKYIIEVKELDDITEVLVRQKAADEAVPAKYAAAVEKETERAAKKILPQIEAQGITSPSVNKVIERYKSVKDDYLQGSVPKVLMLYDALEEVIYELYRAGYDDIVKDHITLRDKPVFRQTIVNGREEKRPRHLIKEYTFSKNIEEYKRELQVLENKTHTAMWQAWERLSLVYLAIIKADEEVKKIRKEKARVDKQGGSSLGVYMSFMGLGMMVDEMQKIRERHERPYTGDTKFNLVYFIKADYIHYATRFHNYLVRELEKDNVQTSDRDKHKQVITDTILKFYPNDGIAEYRAVTKTFKSGTKAGALLCYLHIAKNTPLSISDIQENCNERINVETHKFKTEKDIFDTIAYIRKQLKVNKSEYFPIRKKEKSFIWVEK